jgi:hypothetical protein
MSITASDITTTAVYLSSIPHAQQTPARYRLAVVTHAQANFNNVLNNARLILASNNTEPVGATSVFVDTQPRVDGEDYVTNVYLKRAANYTLEGTYKLQVSSDDGVSWVTVQTAGNSGTGNDATWSITSDLSTTTTAIPAVYSWNADGTADVDNSNDGTTVGAGDNLSDGPTYRVYTTDTQKSTGSGDPYDGWHICSFSVSGGSSGTYTVFAEETDSASTTTGLVDVYQSGDNFQLYIQSDKSAQAARGTAVTVTVGIQDTGGRSTTQVITLYFKTPPQFTNTFSTSTGADGITYSGSSVFHDTDDAGADWVTLTLEGEEDDTLAAQQFAGSTAPVVSGFEFAYTTGESGSDSTIAVTIDVTDIQTQTSGDAADAQHTLTHSDIRVEEAGRRFSSAQVGLDGSNLFGAGLDEDKSVYIVDKDQMTVQTDEIPYVGATQNNSGPYTDADDSLAGGSAIYTVYPNQDTNYTSGGSGLGFFLISRFTAVQATDSITIDSIDNSTVGLFLTSVSGTSDLQKIIRMNEGDSSNTASRTATYASSVTIKDALGRTSTFAFSVRHRNDPTFNGKSSLLTASDTTVSGATAAYYGYVDKTLYTLYVDGIAATESQSNTGTLEGDGNGFISALSSSASTIAITEVTTAGDADATFTNTGDNGLSVGDWVTFTGFLDSQDSNTSQFNGSWEVTTVASTTSFTVTRASGTFTAVTDTSFSAEPTCIVAGSISVSTDASEYSGVAQTVASTRKTLSDSLIEVTENGRSFSPSGVFSDEIFHHIAAQLTVTDAFIQEPTDVYISDLSNADTSGGADQFIYNVARADQAVTISVSFTGGLGTVTVAPGYDVWTRNGVYSNADSSDFPGITGSAVTTSAPLAGQTQTATYTLDADAWAVATASQGASYASNAYEAFAAAISVDDQTDDTFTAISLRTEGSSDANAKLAPLRLYPNLSANTVTTFWVDAATVSSSDPITGVLAQGGVLGANQSVADLTFATTTSLSGKSVQLSESAGQFTQSATAVTETNVGTNGLQTLEDISVTDAAGNSVTHDDITVTYYKEMAVQNLHQSTYAKSGVDGNSGDTITISLGDDETNPISFVGFHGGMSSSNKYRSAVSVDVKVSGSSVVGVGELFSSAAWRYTSDTEGVIDLVVGASNFTNSDRNVTYTIHLSWAAGDDVNGTADGNGVSSGTADTAAWLAEDGTTANFDITFPTSASWTGQAAGTFTGSVSDITNEISYSDPDNRLYEPDHPMPSAPGSTWAAHEITSVADSGGNPVFTVASGHGVSENDVLFVRHPDGTRYSDTIMLVTGTTATTITTDGTYAAFSGTNDSGDAYGRWVKGGDIEDRMVQYTAQSNPSEDLITFTVPTGHGLQVNDYVYVEQSSDPRSVYGSGMDVLQITSVTSTSVTVNPGSSVYTDDTAHSTGRIRLLAGNAVTEGTLDHVWRANFTINGIATISNNTAIVISSLAPADFLATANYDSYEDLQDGTNSLVAYEGVYFNGRTDTNSGTIQYYSESGSANKPNVIILNGSTDNATGVQDIVFDHTTADKNKTFYVYMYPSSGTHTANTTVDSSFYRTLKLRAQVDIASFTVSKDTSRSWPDAMTVKVTDILMEGGATLSTTAGNFFVKLEALAPGGSAWEEVVAPTSLTGLGATLTSNDLDLETIAAFQYLPERAITSSGALNTGVGDASWKSSTAMQYRIGIRASETAHSTKDYAYGGITGRRSQSGPAPTFQFATIGSKARITANDDDDSTLAVREKAFTWSNTYYGFGTVDLDMT